jgi:hypothetical protein
MSYNQYNQNPYQQDSTQDNSYGYGQVRAPVPYELTTNVLTRMLCLPGQSLCARRASPGQQPI